MMTPPPGLAGCRKTLDYVVDIKGNQWSENLAAEVETVEELEQIASAQRKLMRVNYIQV